MNNATMALCGEGRNLGRLRFLAEQVLVRALRSQTPLLSTKWEFKDSTAILGIGANMDVAFIATAGALPEEALGLTGKMLVAARAVSYDYLLPQIRQKNAAYGAGSFYHGSTRVFGASTYRSKMALVTDDLSTLVIVTWEQSRSALPPITRLASIRGRSWASISDAFS